MTTFNKRRRIFYVDKIFQKKLLVLFLGLNVIIVISNVIYYLGHLKGAVENNLFRSHIVLSNLKEIVAGNVFYFNIFLAVVSLVLVVLFYTFARVKLRTFFRRVRSMVVTRQNKRRPEAVRIPEEFQEIDRVLGDFIAKTDGELAEEDRRIIALKEALDRERNI